MRFASVWSLEALTRHPLLLVFPWRAAVYGTEQTVIGKVDAEIQLALFHVDGPSPPTSIYTSAIRQNESYTRSTS